VDRTADWLEEGGNWMFGCHARGWGNEGCSEAGCVSIEAGRLEDAELARR